MIKITVAKSALRNLERRHYDYFRTQGPKAARGVRFITYEQILEITYNTLPSGHAWKPLFHILYDERETILIGGPDRLEAVVKRIESLPASVVQDLKNSKHLLHQMVNKIFNYDSFIGRSPKGWGAYTLTQELKVDVCPYCNRQFISTYYSKGGKTRAALDHFWDKTSHPYLAISFYNLIPSCTVCNSSFKGKKLFSLSDNIHPYVEGFGQDVKFKTGLRLNKDKSGKLIVTDARTLMGKNKHFKIELKTSGTPDFNRRAKANIKAFKLEELYELHKDYVCEMLTKAQAYPDSRLKELSSKPYQRLFPKKEDVKKMVIGNYIEEAELGKRVMAKFMRDLAEEYGML